MATYVSRAYDIGRRYNLTADEMFADALTRAADADAQLASDPTSVGALHGIPISVKDHIAIAGTDATTGCAWHCNEPDTSDSDIITLFRKQGAIPFVKSNIPQIMLWVESDN